MMSKFKIKMKLSGFELEIEGSKDDIPNIQQALSQQLGGLLQPGAGFIEESSPPPMRTIEPAPALSAPVRSAKPRRRTTTSSAAKANGVEVDVALENWPRDVSKYLLPTQSWSTSQKALWILYVALKENLAKEASANQIRDTFNFHYRQAKTINSSNVNRDLGRLKGKVVLEDMTKTPPCWFLMETGITAVEDQIRGAKQGDAK
jgi:hypothetical protein